MSTAVHELTTINGPKRFRIWSESTDNYWHEEPADLATIDEMYRDQELHRAIGEYCRDRFRPPPQISSPIKVKRWRHEEKGNLGSGSNEVRLANMERYYGADYTINSVTAPDGTVTITVVITPLPAKTPG